MRFLYFFKKIWQPEIYQGHFKKKNYFEGWYYKLADASGEQLFAIIPGIFYGNSEEDHHAFIQVLDGKQRKPFYIRYDIHEFTASSHTFEVTIGNSYFSGDKMILDLSGPDLKLQGEMVFCDLKPWPVTLTSPGIMGWYAWVPFMECYHGVLSFDNLINGTIIINDEPVPLTGGRGYMEKDWGISFPSAWVWLQSNHFASPGTSVMVSVAKIPWRGHFFRGFIMGLWHHHTLYKFATYTGAQITSFQVRNEDVFLVVEDKKYRIEIRARNSDYGLLLGPDGKNMALKVAESLTATLQVRLVSVRDREDVIFEGTGVHGGMEVGGKIEEILN